MFNIYTREAGAGELSVAVEGPSDALIKLEERPHGFLGVAYKVKVAGVCIFKIFPFIFGQTPYEQYLLKALPKKRSLWSCSLQRGLCAITTDDNVKKM